MRDTGIISIKASVFWSTICNACSIYNLAFIVGIKWSYASYNEKIIYNKLFIMQFYHLIININ